MKEDWNGGKTYQKCSAECRCCSQNSNPAGHAGIDYSEGYNGTRLAVRQRSYFSRPCICGGFTNRRQITEEPKEIAGVGENCYANRADSPISRHLCQVAPFPFISYH